jgi:hypothetical protein
LKWLVWISLIFGSEKTKAVLIFVRILRFRQSLRLQSRKSNIAQSRTARWYKSPGNGCDTQPISRLAHIGTSSLQQSFRYGITNSSTQGILTLVLQVENFTIGNATIDNMSLVPGANNLPLRATVDLTVVTSNLAAIAKAQPGFATNGTLSIKAISRTATFNGERLPYYETALALGPLVFTSFVNVQKLLAGAPPTQRNRTVGNSSTKASLIARHLTVAEAERHVPVDGIGKRVQPWT